MIYAEEEVIIKLHVTNVQTMTEDECIKLLIEYCQSTPMPTEYKKELLTNVVERNFKIEDNFEGSLRVQVPQGTFLIDPAAIIEEGITVCFVDRLGKHFEWEPYNIEILTEMGLLEVPTTC